MAGGPVPGWDDYDCGEPGVNPSIALSLPNLQSLILFMGNTTGATLGFTAMSIEVGCAGEVECDSEPSPYVATDVFAASPRVEARGLGWYRGGDADGELGPTEGRFPVGTRWVIRNGHDYMEGAACLSRLRPDEVSGVIDLVVHRANEPLDGVLQFYEQITARVPFDYRFQPHAGMYYPVEDECTLDTSEWDGVISYTGSYDDSWPWSDITDPEVRDLLYETYTPCNSP